MHSMNDYIKVLRRNLKKALATRQLDEAADLLLRLKETDPLSLETQGLDLEYQITVGRQKNALEMAVQLVRRYAGSARIQYLAGRAYYLVKQYDQAVQHFSESDRIHPHWRARRWLGKSHTQKGTFVEAEASFLALAGEHSIVALDLAWLYERMKRPEEALTYVEAYLKNHPEDDFAKAQKLRLESHNLEPDELAEEVQTLSALGEEVPPELFAAYIESLLATGRGDAARSLLLDGDRPRDDRTTASVAWICHRLRAYDLALQMFLQALPSHLHDVKYLSALESSARHCNRVEDVVASYTRYSEEDKRFFGRIKGLNKR